MAAYASTITPRRARKDVIDEDLYTRYEITGGTAAWKGEIYVPKGNTQPVSTDTLTITVATP